MNTTEGWYRAKLKLKGIDVDYNSLEELYYIHALKKEEMIELKKNLAIIASNLKLDNEKKNEKVKEYVEEALPSIAEERENFVEQAQDMLDEFAGETIDLSEYETGGV